MSDLVSYKLVICIAMRAVTLALNKPLFQLKPNLDNSVFYFLLDYVRLAIAAPCIVYIGLCKNG